MPQTDVLIIGSGIAGLSFAIKVAQRFPNQHVTVVTKADKGESNTKYAQGGIAVVLDKLTDSFQKHIEDTLRAGDGLCDKEVVEIVIREAPDRLKEIMDWGVAFDRNESGDLDLGREGGHTAKRIVHYKDVTGLQIEKALLKQVELMPNIELLSHHFAIDLITEHHFKYKISLPEPGITCYGAYVMDQKTCRIEKYISRITLLATAKKIALAKSNKALIVETDNQINALFMEYKMSGGGKNILNLV